MGSSVRTRYRPTRGGVTITVAEIHDDADLLFFSDEEREMVEVHTREISHISIGTIKLYELLNLCEKGWFLELYVHKDSHKYFAIEQYGPKSLVEQWEEKGLSHDVEVIFDGFDPIDKIMYAYFLN